MGLKLVTPPTVYPVTLPEMKKQLNIGVENTDDDAFIRDVIIPAATGHIDGKDGWLQRALCDQTWDLMLDAFPCEAAIRIPLPPLIEVLSLKYDDERGDEQTYASGNYVVDDAGSMAWLVRNSDVAWPTTIDAINSVRIRFRAGYLDSTSSPPVANVPAPIKAAIMMYGATLHRSRETIVIGQSVAQLPWAAEELLRPYRVFA